jgi:hypothetical protein
VSYCRKAQLAEAHGVQPPQQDWSGMAAILHRIVIAHQTEP